MPRFRIERITCRLYGTERTYPVIAGPRRGDPALTALQPRYWTVPPRSFATALSTAINPPPVDVFGTLGYRPTCVPFLADHRTVRAMPTGAIRRRHRDAVLAEVCPERKEDLM
jgi:hypothetical protein